MKKPSRSRRPVVHTRETLTAALGRARVKAEADYQAYRADSWEADVAERTPDLSDVPALVAGGITHDAKERAERSARRVAALERRLEAMSA